MSDHSDAIPQCGDTDETTPYAGAIALAAFNGAILGGIACAVEWCLRDAGSAIFAGLGALVCFAIWERQILGADGTERP
jgi:hypothetical protein